MGLRICTIGDIHGRTEWKTILFGSYENYNTWRIAVDSKHSIFDLGIKFPFTSYDKIIFVGDYVDSFTVSNIIIKSNLLDIIHFKKALRDQVVLLIGNHDISYIVHNQTCQGFRPEMKFDFAQIFNENMKLFVFAHEEIGEDGRYWLWTHAGVTSRWLSEFRAVLCNPNWRFYKISKDWDLDNICEILNNAWEMRLTALFSVDLQSGGFSPWASPVWCRPKRLNLYPILRVNQVVGHTPCDNVWSNLTYVDEVSKLIYHNYFVDCLAEGIIFDKTI